MLREHDEGDVVGIEQGRHPERWNPVRRSHEGRGIVDRRQGDGRDEIQGTPHIEDPHQWFCRSSFIGNSRDCDEREDRGCEIAKCTRIRKLRAPSPGVSRLLR